MPSYRPREGAGSIRKSKAKAAVNRQRNRKNRPKPAPVTITRADGTVEVVGPDLRPLRGEP